MSRRRRIRRFYKYEPGVDVPRDVMHLLVPPGIEVLPEGVFQGLAHLRVVTLSEGLREIGRMAFRFCKLLRRVHFPSTLVRIDDVAFGGCTSLTTLHFSGLGEIGRDAFRECSSLTRISLSSTLKKIGYGAFYGCFSLEVVILVDGIQAIGRFAFARCALEAIILPATLTSIGLDTFVLCRSLRMVKLSGGIQLIERDAFVNCHLLDSIKVISKCLVVTRTGVGLNFNFATDGRIPPNDRFARIVIASECFYSMCSAEVSAFEIDIAEILGMSLGWGGKHERLLGLLAIHERRHKEEVAGLLELGLRKAEMPDVIIETTVAFL